MAEFNKYQYDDLLARPADAYAAAKYAIIQRWLRGQANLNILNAGCGSGDLSFPLAAAGHRVTGIDPVPEYIAVAQARNTGPAAARCTFQVAAIEDFKAAEPFDVVIATDVIEHIEDDRAAIAKLAGLTRPGGRIILTVPAGQWLFGFHDESLGHYRRYCRRTLKLAAADFCRVRRTRYFGWTLMPACWWFSKHKRKPYPVANVSDPKASPVKNAILRCMLATDRLLPLPLGTSLLLEAVKP